MSKEEKIECVKRIGEKFVKLPSEEKDFVTGYIVGRAEERSKWEADQGKVKEA